jgi:hypothetical protein
MATVNKDFKIKSGLIVEGTSATVNGNQVLTENASDQYIIDLIGGETLVTSVNSTQLEVVNGELSVKSGVFDADGSADTAEQNAKNYADGLAVNYDAAGSATTAENNAKSYADGLASNYDPAGSASTAENNAKSYADGLASNYDPAGSASTAEQNAKNYADDLINDGSTTTTNVWSAYKTSTEIGLVDTAAQGYANSAETSANEYTDGEISTALTTAQGYADTAEANANAYTDNAVSGLNWKQAVNLLYDAAIPVLSGSGASQLIVDGHDPLGDADSGYRVLITQSSNAGIYVFNSTAGSWTLTRAEDADEFGELIGSAVYVMEGTQYGSTSWVQSNHYITNFSGQSWTQFSGQGSVTAGSGITVDGLEVSINRTTVDNWYDEAGAASAAQTAAEEYADGLASNYDPAGSAQGAYDNAVTYVDGEITTALTTAQGYADTAESDANTYTDNAITNGLAVGGAIKTAIDAAETDANSYTDTEIGALTTDDIEEGLTNQYFTDSRARTSIVDALTNANKTNIEITANVAGVLSITAENGVADSDTDDLVEGSTNLYFTNTRVIDAVDNADITPNTVTIDTFRKEEATQQYVASASTVTVHNLPAGFESAKYLVRVVGTVGGTKHSQLTEILMTVDGNNNIAITEYGTICTNTTNLASFTADVALGGIPYLSATTAVGGCEIIVAATMLSWDN